MRPRAQSPLGDVALPSVDFARELADSLPQLRQEAGLTQEQMGRRLGVSRPTLTRLENADQNMTLRTLAQLCRALRCRPGDLFEPGQLRLASRRGRSR